MSRPTSTYKSFLMYKPEGQDSYQKLLDIKEYPDLGGAPGTIDVTTLSQGQKTYVNDIKDPGSMEFNANYDPDDYEKCKALEGKRLPYAVWFGGEESGVEVTPKGDLGKFEFEGELSIYVKGGGVSAARDMGITIAPATEIVKAKASGNASA